MTSFSSKFGRVAFLAAVSVAGFGCGRFRERALLQEWGAGEGVPIQIAFSPKSDVVAAALAGPHKIAVWNVADGKRRFLLGTDSVRAATSVAFSPDDRTLAGIGDNGKAVLLWDWRTGERLKKFPLP